MKTVIYARVINSVSDEPIENGMVEIGYTLRGSARPLDNAFHINSSRKNITLRHMRFLVAL